MGLFKEKFKKAFTLIESAIVIAVISVLIAITVPTFITIISSAKNSNDSVTVKQINDALAIIETTDGKPDNVISTFEGLYDYGFSPDDFNLNDNNRLVYNSDTNRMLLYSSDFTSVIYPEESATTTIVAAYSATNLQRSELCVIGIENIETAIRAGFDQFYFYSTESNITIETSSEITLWLYIELDDVYITVNENTNVIHNKYTPNCTTSKYRSLSDDSYNTAEIDTDTPDNTGDSSVSSDTETDNTDASDTDNPKSDDKTSSTESSTEQTDTEDEDSNPDSAEDDGDATGDSSEDDTDTGDSSAGDSEGDKSGDTQDGSTGDSDTGDGGSGTEEDGPSGTGTEEGGSGETQHTHQYVNCKIVKEATCTETGIKEIYCICGECIEETIDKLGHDYMETNVAPTVDERGHTLYTCTRCGDSYKDNYTQYLCTESLTFEKSSDGTYYIVTGITDASETDIYIPSYYRAEENEEYLPVKEIKANAFYDNDDIINVTIGSMIEKIGDYAFYHCSNLKKVNIPSSLKTFGTESFSRCSQLSEIYYEAVNADNLSNENVFVQAGISSGNLVLYISKDVTRIPDNLFNISTSGLQACIVSIIFEKNSICTEIGRSAFYTVNNLTTIVLPTTITKSYDYSFDDTSTTIIYYMGTQEQWEASDLGSKKYATKAKDIYYYSETYSEGCWYYDEDGVITLWKKT